ncbi:MAG: RIP metalloprotease [Proteobacteria bacterium]|nr:RIP metalloprotease [Pseudomonadota bacterium]
MFTSIIAVVLVLGGLIFFHELGHFLVARSMGMGIKTFSLGFGPELWGTTRGRTRYKLSMVPLGGYVSLAGESPEEEATDEEWPEEQLFMARPPFQRLLVVLSGPVFNFVLAWLLYWCVFMGLGHVPVFEYEVKEVLDGSPALLAGIQPGDIFTEVNGDTPYTPDTLQLSVLLSQDTPLDFLVLRDGQSFATSITPGFLSEEDRTSDPMPMPKIGVVFQARPAERPLGMTLGAVAAADKCMDAIAQTGKSLLLIVQGKVSAKAVGGPIMIVQEVGTRAQSGLIDVLLLAAFISINLGFLNLLPIPVLDGGHIFFFLYEMARGKAVNDEFRRFATYLGITFLLGLMLLAFYNDLYRIFA